MQIKSPGPNYVILDFETTSLDADNGEIFEIAAIEMCGLKPIRDFTSFVAISGSLPEESKRISKVDDDSLTGAPALADIAARLIEFIGDLPVVAQNAQFDREWFAKHIAPHSERDSYAFYDSVDVFALVLSHLPSHSEDNLRAYFQIKQEFSHRALTDCDDLVALLNQTHEFLESRPEVVTIVRKFLLEPESKWWWSWFFETDIETPSIEQFASSQAKGDLEVLRDVDDNRNGDWSQSPDPGAIVERLQIASLASNVLQFKRRPNQERMAAEVANAIKHGDRIAIEAPTGTGKTVAYLLPAVLAAKSIGVPVVVATESKILQNQILSKDKSIVSEMLGDKSLKVVKVKGQQNYFCLRKLFATGEAILKDGIDGHSVDRRWAISYLYSLALSSPASETDDISHFLLSTRPVLVDLIAAVRSHSQTTIVQGLCPHYQYCRYFNSSRLAHEADVIVANHSLVFQWPRHLPKIRDIIFDEGHHLEDQIGKAYSSVFDSLEFKRALGEFLGHKNGKISGTSKSISRLIQEQSNENQDLLHTFFVPKVKDILDGFSDSERAIASIFEGTDFDPRYEAEVDLDAIQHGVQLTAILGELYERVSIVTRFLKEKYESLKTAVPLTQRGMMDLHSDLRKFSDWQSQLYASTIGPSKTHLRSISYHSQKGWKFNITPVSVAGAQVNPFENFRSIVLTSATLSSDYDLTRIPKRISLALTKKPIRLPSSFNLARQSRIYFPADLECKAGDFNHQRALIEFTVKVAEMIGGRTLLLMTSNERARKAAESLIHRLKGTGIAVLFGSGSGPIERFKENPRAVFIGTNQHGEGLDIPGQTLSCVIIERIDARVAKGALHSRRELELGGGVRGLFGYTIPRRLLWLKQRVGRLIRTEEDRGWIIVFDPAFAAWKPATQDTVKRALYPFGVDLIPTDEILARILRSKAHVLREDTGS